MNKVALFTPMLQPYRISFYEKLASRDPNFEWIIYHGVKNIEDGRPAYSGKTKFKNIGLKEIKFHLGPFEVIVIKGLLKEIKKFNPDILITQGISGNLSNRLIVSWSKQHKKKIIFWTCGWEPGRAKGILLKFKNKLVSVLFKKANLHLTYSTTANKYVQKMGVAPGNIITCYNGIEIDKLLKHENLIRKKALEIRTKFELNNHTTFLYVGGLIPEKRPDLLIDAFSELRKRYNSIKLLIIGDGPEKEKIIQKISLLNDPNIYYLGRIIYAADQYFAASDCMVLPGIGGLALNQAMFWGKICIASEADGTEDDLVIEGKTGFRFKKGDLQSLINAMEKMILTKKEVITQMSEACREIIVKKSNVNNMLDIFYSSMKNLTDKKS